MKLLYKIIYIEDKKWHSKKKLFLLLLKQIHENVIFHSRMISIFSISFSIAPGCERRGHEKRKLYFVKRQEKSWQVKFASI